MRPAHRTPPPHLVHHAVALPRWQRQGVAWATALVWASGALWLALHWGWPALSDEGLPLNAPGKLWSVRLHGAGVLLILLVIGGLMPVHIRLAWRLRRHRLGGVLNLALLGALTASGYALWYASDGGWHEAAEWLHWVVGLPLPLVLWHHAWWAQRRRRHGG